MRNGLECGAIFCPDKDCQNCKFNTTSQLMKRQQQKATAAKVTAELILAAAILAAVVNIAAYLK